MKNLFENIEEIKNSNLKLSFNKKINLKERFFLNFLINTSIKKKKIILEIEKDFFYKEIQEVIQEARENCKDVLKSLLNKN
jgi:hypothetical protein